MFTGIVQKMGPVTKVEKADVLRYSVQIGDERNLVIGASVAVDGVCQTVVAIDGECVTFEAIPETLARTTLGAMQPGMRVNVERAAKVGDEIGGHLLSGHIYGTARIDRIVDQAGMYAMHFALPEGWTRFILPKGFIAIDGASLTVVDVEPENFSVHLIPHTRLHTTLGYKRVGERVNIELDAQTQTIVTTVERILGQR